jgi:hypothetical protein
MVPTPYSVSALWEASLRDLPGRRPSFFTGSLFVLAFIGLLAWWAAGSAMEDIWRVALPLVILLPAAVASVVLLRARIGSRKRGAALTRLTVLLQVAFSALFLLVLSGYAFRIALDVGVRFAQWPRALMLGLMGLYGATALAALLWAPRSLPRSPEHDELAAKRGGKWLPWVMGCQGFLISTGVFVGVWFLHDESPWEYALVIGIAALASTLLLFFGILIVHRFALLALCPIPPGLLHKSNSQVE